MNRNHETRQQAIEKLIDGELTTDEERDLLTSFGQDPSGWQDLAEMFLEDRILRDSLSSNSQQPIRIAESAVTNAKQPSRTHWLTRFATIATLVLAAFFSGRFSVAAPEQTAPSQVAEVERKPDTPIQNELTEHRLPPPVEFVTLNLTEDGEVSHQIEVPLMSWDEAVVSYSAGISSDPKSLVPRNIREIFARRGQTVDAQMTYVPFETLDGRAGFIPVSQIEVRPNRFPEIQ